MAKRRLYFGRGALNKDDFAIRIQDEVTSFMNIGAINFPSEADRTIRHAASVARRVVVNYMEKDEHGKPLTKFQENQVIERLEGGRGYARKKFAGDVTKSGRGLRRAVNYRHFKGEMKAVLGWSTSSAKRHGIAFQGGVSYQMTQKQANFFFALARKARGYKKKILLALGKRAQRGGTMKIPGRPIFDPAYRKIKPKLPKIMENRMARNLGNVSTASYDAWLYSLTGITANDLTSRSFARRMKARRKNAS